jgi:hypothetical protein
MKFGPSRLEMTLLTGTTYFDRNWLAHLRLSIVVKGISTQNHSVMSVLGIYQQSFPNAPHCVRRKTGDRKTGDRQDDYLSVHGS